MKTLTRANDLSTPQELEKQIHALVYTEHIRLARFR